MFWRANCPKFAPRKCLGNRGTLQHVLAYFASARQGFQQCATASRASTPLLPRMGAQCGTGPAHVGTHGIRHRSATDIANSGVPIKVGMALTAQKTVATFMGYVHTQDQEEREASDVVAKLRKLIASGQQATPAKAEEAAEVPQALAELFKLLKRSPELLRGLEAT